MTIVIAKFPCDVSRRVHSRKPAADRRTAPRKNARPPKRGGVLAARKATSAAAIPQMGSPEWRKVVGLFIDPEAEGKAAEAVKCLQGLIDGHAYSA